MPTIIRVKRRADEEPVAEYMLNAKKRLKISDENGAQAADDKSDEVCAVLKFAGTTSKPDDDAEISKLATPKSNKILAEEHVERKGLFRSKYTDVKQAEQQKRQQNRRAARFRVVNCQRVCLPSAEEQSEYAIVDVEEKVKSNEKQAAELADDTAKAEYVYDIYVQKDQKDLDVAQYEDIRVGVHHDMVMEDYYDDEEEHDSEDSNAEDYYMNDYPDEEDEDGDSNDSNSDAEMHCEFSGFRLEDDDDVSTASSSSDDDHASYKDPYRHYASRSKKSRSANMLHDDDDEYVDEGDVDDI